MAIINTHICFQTLCAKIRGFIFFRLLSGGNSTNPAIKNWFMFSVRISSYGCTREVWRARKKRKSCSNQLFFVPCGRVVQRAYYRELAQVLSNLKGHCHTIWQLQFIKSCKVPSHQLNSKTNDLVLLSKHDGRLLGLFLLQV